MIRLLPLLSAATAVAWGLPATAQVTADDVWSNSDAYAAAFGARQSGVLARQGDTVSVSEFRTLWDLPMGFGAVSFELSDYDMTENPDGTVTITYRAPVSMRIDVALTGGDSGGAILSIGPDAIVSTASGEPGAISYQTTTGPIRVELSELSVPDAAGIAFELVYEVESSETLTRVLEDSLTVIYSATDLGPASSSVSIQTPDGIVSDSQTTIAPSRSVVNMGLLPTGASILDLSGALRDGMYISAESTTGRSESSGVDMVDGRVITRSDVIIGGSQSSLTFDREGVSATSDGGELLVDLTIPDDFLGAIGFGLSSFRVDYKLPLLASPDPQTFRFAMGLGDLRLGPSLWAQVDPGKVLDRSPFQFNLDTSGTVLNDIEWLDILSLEGLQFENEFPLEILDLAVPDLFVSGLGASFDGDASFTFDNTDTVTYPGFPRPTGSAGFVLSGLNTVLDFMGETGVLSSDELFGFRMGLGMVTDPGNGPDVQTGRIELTEDGQIIANGQRLR